MGRGRGIWQLTCAAAVLLGGTAALRAQEVFQLTERGFEQVETPDPATPEGQIHEIRRLIAENRARDARRRADRWIKAHPNHPLMPEAYLLRGDARVAGDDWYKALFDYEYVLRAFPESPQFEQALERELKIAEGFVRGVRRKFLGMRMLPAQEEGEELLIRIQERAPGSRIAERAGIELADHYYRRSNMTMAAQAYELFLLNYPNSQWREHAMQRQIMSNLASFRGPRFDATGLIEAQTRLGDFKQAYPAAADQIGADALLHRVDESLATRALLIAQWYDKQRNFVAAEFMYQRVLRDHPHSAPAHEALDRLRQLNPRRWALDTAPPPPPSQVPTPPGPPQPPAPADVPIPPTPNPQAAPSDAPPAAPPAAPVAP